MVLTPLQGSKYKLCWQSVFLRNPAKPLPSPVQNPKKNKKLKISHPQLLNLYKLPGRFEVSTDHSMKTPQTQPLKKPSPRGSHHRNLQSPDDGHMQTRNHCFVTRNGRSLEWLRLIQSFNECHHKDWVVIS